MYTGNLEENMQRSGTYYIPEDFSVLCRGGGGGANPARPSQIALVGKVLAAKHSDLSLSQESI